MADGFIVRKGGVATEQALAPTITQVATTETSITFTITNNDAETAIIRHRLDDITDEGVIVELATNATSANITVSNLAEGTEFTVFATTNVTGKVKSNVTQLTISTNKIPAPTITLVSNTDTSVIFTLTNNSVETRDVTFGLTTPPTTTTISLASDATSGNQTFSNLDPDTFITLFAQAEGGLIGQLNVTTDPAVVFTAATGGTTLEYDDGGKRYKSHTFLENGNFVVSTVGDNIDDRNKVDYLIISGGGGGGAAGNSIFGAAGGGGAGGFLTTIGTQGGLGTLNPKFTVNQQNFTITVGAGGAGSTDRIIAGTNGGNSLSTTISSLGGGGGAGAGAGNGENGGSGGGGAQGDVSGNTGGTFAPGTGTAGQGFGGGTASGTGTSSAGGGGGGAGQSGANSTPNNGGDGGNGLANLLRTGSNETRAGGGGGGSSAGSKAGNGGSGGGGAGSLAFSGNSAVENTGGGGGGAGKWTFAGPGIGGNGGSGIVVIRYEIRPNV